MQVRVRREQTRKRKQVVDEDKEEADAETGDFESAWCKRSLPRADTAAAAAAATTAAPTTPAKGTQPPQGKGAGNDMPEAAKIALQGVRQPQGKGAGNDMPEAAKIALQGVRRTHSAWDRFIREARGVIEHSKSCSTTADSKLEQDLNNVILEGAEPDTAILAWESQVSMSSSSSSSLSSSSIKTVAQHCADLEELMKSGRKKIAALKYMFKL